MKKKNSSAQFLFWIVHLKMMKKMKFLLLPRFKTDLPASKVNNIKTPNLFFFFFLFLVLEILRISFSSSCAIKWKCNELYYDC